MSDAPNDTPNKNDGDIDLFNRLPAPSPFTRRSTAPPAQEEDPIEEFWATFAMITHTGERFTLSICFRNRRQYNTEMHKLETAKNIHVVIKDINDEAIVVKRDILLYVIPAEEENALAGSAW